MSVRDAEWGALGEGEELLFEGGARGRPPLRPALPIYLAVWLLPYLLGALMLLLAWKHAPVAPAWEVSARFVAVTWEHGGSSATTHAAGPLWGPIDADLPGVGPIEVPWTIVVLLGVAGLELLRLARWRSHRLAVTTRRVLLARGVVRRRFEVHARTGHEGLHPLSDVEDQLSGLVGDRAVRVRGLDAADRLALERVFQRFEPGPTPPPPDARLPWRALLFFALLAALATAIGLRGAAAPDRVTLVARRSGTPGEQLIQLTVDSPSWGGLRVSPWNDGRPLGAGSSGRFGEMWTEPTEVVGARLERAPLTLERVELDGGPWQFSRLQGKLDARWDSGFFRVTLSLTLEEHRALIAAERVVVAGKLHTVDGRELPFEVSLPAPGAVTLELAPSGP